MEDQKSWQLEQPQGTPLYTVDAHSTQGMYVKRMLLINRRNLWQLAAAARPLHVLQGLLHSAKLLLPKHDLV